MTLLLTISGLIIVVLLYFLIIQYHEINYLKGEVAQWKHYYNVEKIKRDRNYERLASEYVRLTKENKDLQSKLHKPRNEKGDIIKK